MDDTLRQTTEVAIDDADGPLGRAYVEVGTHAGGDVYLLTEDGETAVTLRLSRAQALALVGHLTVATLRA